MIQREVTVSKAFHDLHGEKTRLSTLLLVYLSGLIVAGIVVAQLFTDELPAWKIICTGILFLDVTGGVVANLSTSTNQYYQSKANLRLVFLLLHIFHPVILMVIFPAGVPYAVFTLLFTLSSAFLVNAVKDQEFQQNLAALLVTIGICLSFLISLPIPILHAFAPLFMVKLILGFAVRRPPFYSADPA